MSILRCIALATVSLSLLATTAEAGFKQIRKEKDFAALVVGKTVAADNSTIVINADGTLSGKTTDGQRIIGAWKWGGRYWCRNVTVAKTNLGQDCQKMEIDGNKLRVTRDKGRGDVINAVLK